MPKKFQLIFASLALLICGCSATSVHRTAKSATHTGGPVRKVAVLAVYERDFYRASVESHFNVQLHEGGQDAFVTHDLLSLPVIKADKEKAAATLRRKGADAVLLIRLAGRSSSDHEVRATSPSYSTTMTGYESGDWYGYYSTAFMDMSTVWGGSQREVHLDISLFDLNTKEQLWSGQTDSVLRDETDRVEALSALAGKVVAAIRKDGFIR